MTTASINHTRVGSGEPLVLIHGIGHRWQAWGPVLDRLAAHHEVIAIDLPGFGQSPPPASGMPAGMPATIEMVISALADFGLDRPHVAGNSLGGAISLELAAAGAVASATAFSPAGFYTRAERIRALATLRLLRANTYLPTPVLRAVLRSGFIRGMSFAPLLAHPRRLDPERAFGDALALRRARGFETVVRAAREYRFEAGRLADSTVPVTVGWGDRDRVLGVQQAERVRAALPHARVVIMPGCGHVPMSDDPELVANLILQTTGALPRVDAPARQRAEDAPTADERA
ncbi:MAG TPA: alpha/beta fold hydrolase [Micromonosporaceae bacterium]